MHHWREVPPSYAAREIRREIFIGAGVAVLLVLVWASVFGGMTALKAKQQLQRAEVYARHLTHSRSELLSPYGRITVGQRIATMGSLANQANHELQGSAALTVLSWLPIVGSQVDAVRHDAQGVVQLASQGQLLLGAASLAANASHGNHVDLATLSALDAQVHRSLRIVRRLPRSTGGLFGPVASLQRNFNRQVLTIQALLASGGRALDFAQVFLGGQGSRSYLVAGENSSEMRDQGSVLSWALLRVDGGTFTVSHSASVGTVSLRQPAVPITDAGTQAAFGALEPTRVWQNVNAVGSFTTSAPWMRQMIAQANGTAVSGVVGLDVVALADILKVVGPVQVTGIRELVTASNVETLLYHTLYLRYPAGAQSQRHDLVAAVAQAAVDRMAHGGFDVAALLQALSTAIPGRHLVFWDANAQLEHDVAGFGAAGGLTTQGSQTFHLAVEAGVAAKLDWYITSNVSYNVRFASDGTAYVTEIITLHNAAPAHARPSYALGPDNTNSHRAGEYVARLYQWLPSQTEAPGAVPEEGLTLEHTVLRVEGQQSRRVVLNAIIPGALRHGSIVWHFVPQSTIHPTRITVHVTDDLGLRGPTTITWRNNHPVTLSWTKR